MIKDFMNKAMGLVMVTVGLMATACTSESVESDKQQSENFLTFEESMKFKNVIDSVAQIVSPVILEGRTRSMNNEDYDGFILSHEDSIVLQQQGNAIIEASKDYFNSIGITDAELKEIVGEDHEYTIATAALICMSIVHDNELLTRAITGNTYIDCALSATGFDLPWALRSALSEGISLAAAKKLIRKTLSASLGSSIGIAITAGLWAMCVGGIG